jgi:hypothetical protein
MAAPLAREFLGRYDSAILLEGVGSGRYGARVGGSKTLKT